MGYGAGGETRGGCPVSYSQETRLVTTVADAPFSPVSTSIGKKMARKVFAAHGDVSGLTFTEAQLASAFAAAAEAMQMVMS